MRIIFERSGGVMGLKSGITINMADLPADQAAALRALLDAAKFFTLPENPPARSNPDGFQYVITVEGEETKHTVHASDTTAPEELRPLLQELSQRARLQRRS